MYEGVMDEVRLYNRPLSASEVVRRYNQTLLSGVAKDYYLGSACVAMRTSAGVYPLSPPNSEPSKYVIMPAMMPTAVISRPLAHQVREVTRDLAAPTAKWARMLMAKAITTAIRPLRKKKGMSGMNAPSAVESIEDSSDFQGFGKLVSDRPNSSCASVFRYCSGFCWMRETSVLDSLSLKPLSW